MPIYHYQAFDSSGKKRTGLIEGSSEREAREKLRSQSFIVTKLTGDRGGKAKENLRGDNLVAFTLLLSQLVASGLPLYDSLITIEEEYRNEPYHRVLASLAERVKGGESLSQAMSTFPESFSRLYCSMVAAGEAAGALPIVLERLNHFLGREMKLRKRISTAMIYPAILACFALLVIALLLGFVIPSIEAIFVDRELNWFTELVLSISRFMRAQWWIYFPLVLCGGGALYWWLTTPKGKQWRESTALKIPLVRTLVIQGAVARFCRTLGTLLTGGVSMIESLQLAREVMHNKVLEAEVKIAEERVVEGRSLSQEISRSRYIPHMVARMLAIGEESGSLAEMLNKVADIYEDEVEKTLDRVMALAQPVILLIMGFIIGMVLLAVLLPMTDISSFTQAT
ncbi:MAG: type II secretion system F family protein [Chlamydiia bacterium]|nr:type II secretion system F family protein [Chlamydiia bacterium]